MAILLVYPAKGILTKFTMMKWEEAFTTLVVNGLIF